MIADGSCPYLGRQTARWEVFRAINYPSLFSLRGGHPQQTILLGGTWYVLPLSLSSLVHKTMRLEAARHNLVELDT